MTNSLAPRTAPPSDRRSATVGALGGLLTARWRALLAAAASVAIRVRRIWEAQDAPYHRHSTVRLAGGWE